MGEAAETNSSGLVLAIDLGGTNIRGALIDRAGKIHSRVSNEVSKDRSEKGTTDQILRLISDFQSRIDSPESKILGIGLGIPGFVNADDGVIYSSPNYPEWKDFPLANHVRSKFSGLEFVLENDANCAVVGEWWVGAGAGLKNIIMLTFGTGVGGGVLINEKLLLGTHGASSELGHIVIEPEGPPCGCGSRGCLEQLISGGAMKRKYGKTSKDLFDSAENGDEKAIEAFRLFGRHLGIGLTTMGYMFDPQMFILGGRVSRAYKYFEKSMNEELRLRMRNHPARDVIVAAAKNDDDAGLYGAAKLAFQRFDT